jgi:putative ABC transport system substrate-binding protein
MDYILRKGLSVCIAAAFIINLFVAEARAEKRIGVLLFSEENRYHETLKGFMNELEKSGYGPTSVTYTIENAGGSKVKAGVLAKKFSSEKTDLMLTLGTSATIAVSKEIKDIPIVFSQVYDPIDSGIARDMKSSGNNTTGASTRIPVGKIIKNLQAFAPAGKLAVPYTPGEKNSEAVLKELQANQKKLKIKVVPVILSKQEEVAEMLSIVAPTVDAIYLTGSMIVSATVPVIVEIANKSKVVTITHIDDLVLKGALMGVCTNSYHLGTLAGKKAVKILKGAKPSSMPIDPASKLDILFNMKTAKAGQFQIPPAFMKTVTKTIE